MARKKSSAVRPTGDGVSCFIKQLPESELLAAAETAIAENPANAPLETFVAFVPGGGAGDSELSPLSPQRLAVLTSKYWGAGGKVLTVGWLDGPNAETRRLILQYANKWSQYGNVKFVESATDPVVRISRTPGDGYWSYLGTDVLRVPRGQPTMNLAGFTERTRPEEYERVVVHEFGHTLGCPHEHLRPEIVALIDERKALDYFRRHAGWNEQITRSNVLTPLDVRSITGSTVTDPVSVMTYPLPGEIMKDGRPIPGGPTLSPTDKMFFGQLYPLPEQPPPPPTGGLLNLTVNLDRKEVVVALPQGWTLGRS